MPRTDSTDNVAAYLDELLAQPLPQAAPKPAVPVPAPVVTPVVEARPEPPKTEPVAAKAAAPVPKPAAGKPGDPGFAPDSERRTRRASDRMERWIGFQLAGQMFGVEVLSVLEVQRVGEITPAPGAGPDLMGAINLRGQIVPVMDLGLRLGFPRREPTVSSRLIVVDYKGQPVGFCVDGVSEVITAKTSSIEAAPRLGGRIGAGWIKGVLRNKGDSVLLLDPVKLLADVEGV